jgi:hypothetical protein
LVSTTGNARLAKSQADLTGHLTRTDLRIISPDDKFWQEENNHLVISWCNARRRELMARQTVPHQL